MIKPKAELRRQATHVARCLEPVVRGLPQPLIQTIIEEYGKDPFLILIGCLLSLRARDVVTIHVCRELFSRAQTPREIRAIPRLELEAIVHRLGFFRTKAATLHAVCRCLIEWHRGEVPKSRAKLEAVPGVGLKTANLVLGLAFGEPAICVDTHVHTISNRLGLVQTQTPEQTEAALREILPRELWIEWNRLLVIWGQNRCRLPKDFSCPGCPLLAGAKK